MLNRALIAVVGLMILVGSLGAAAGQPAGKKGAGGAGGGGAAKDAGNQEVLIKNDKRKRYFLINPKPEAKAPASGYKLLVVLPGGDGSDEFNPFVQNIAGQALPPGYLVAQAVAPKWSKPEEIVWPTAKLRDPTMKFTTEEFVQAIIEDVKSKYAIDAKYVFTLGWSSGGPPCYAAALTPKCGVAGSFVAMSVFKPEGLPPLTNAKGKAFYILHSPTDFIQMRFPEAARDELAAKGAKTTLATYDGGHGWHGDVFGNIRKGVVWLEGNVGK